MTPVTLALTPREVRIVECNGNMAAKLNSNDVYALHPEYLSQIVVLGDEIIEMVNRKIRSNCYIIFQMIYRIEIVINVFNAASITRVGCSSKIVYTKLLKIHYSN